MTLCIYGHDRHFGYVTSITVMNFHFLVSSSLHLNLAGNGLVVTEKIKFIFHMLMTLGQGQEMTSTFNTHIYSLTQLVSDHRLQ